MEKNPVTFTQHEKYLTQEFCWFWPIIQHDLSHLVGIACFNFSWNFLLSFRLLFLALLVIIKQVYLFLFIYLFIYLLIYLFIYLSIYLFIYLFIWNLNVQSFTLFIWMRQFSIWSENVQRSPKFSYIYIFSFSSKNPRTLQPLPRGWHQNWQPTFCQEGAKLC